MTKKEKKSISKQKMYYLIGRYLDYRLKEKAFKKKYSLFGVSIKTLPCVTNMTC